MSEFSCIAFIPVYNEADILPWVLNHLLNQGIQPWVIDNWSTDVLYPTSSVFFDRWPLRGPSGTYDWEDILRRIEWLSMKECGTDSSVPFRADWCMLHDADEIRRSPRAGETLLQALQRFDQDGATAADFQVAQFWPTDDTWDGSQDPEKHFQYYEQPGVDRFLPHVKAWKNNGQQLTLAERGGHVAVANPRLPLSHDDPSIPFKKESLILKHYPIRSTAQATRKLDQDRFPRWNAEERARNWHVQYDELVKTRKFIRDPKTLRRWEGV